MVALDTDEVGTIVGIELIGVTKLMKKFKVNHETIDISETHDAMTMKVKVDAYNRRTPYKYIIKFDRHRLQEIFRFRFSRSAS